MRSHTTIKTDSVAWLLLPHQGKAAPHTFHSGLSAFRMRSCNPPKDVITPVRSTAERVTPSFARQEPNANSYMYCSHKRQNGSHPHHERRRAAAATRHAASKVRRDRLIRAVWDKTENIPVRLFHLRLRLVATPSDAE